MKKWMGRAVFCLVAVGIIFSLACGGPTSDLRGVVAAATPEAAEAGKEMLDAGGNAVDAAVSAALTLAVTEPAGSGLGGQSTLIIHRPREAPVVVNGTSFSPRSLPADVRSMKLEGRNRSTVPSTVRVLDHVLRTHGSGKISWSDALQPAIRFAEEGFVWGSFRYRSLVRYSEMLGSDPTAAAIFLEADGSLPSMNSRLRQPLLSQTLRRLAEKGADDFYRGEMAREIAADMESNGGWITLEDLAGVATPLQKPALRTTYRGWEVYSSPPPTGGWVVLQILNVLEQAPAEQLAEKSMGRSIWLAEALRVGHRNRKASPVSNLIRYEDGVNDRISKTVAWELARGIEPPSDAGETTHLSVVDGSGMAVGLTQSLNSHFGTRVAHPKLGFLYNDYLKEFERADPQHPFALKSNAMPFSSIAPTILSRNGRVGLVLGSPGSTRIISAVAQTISHWIDVGQGIEAAVAAHRLHVAPENDLFFEATQLDDSTRSELTRRGFLLRRNRFGQTAMTLDPFYGGVHAVAWEDGHWVGAADPRRDGAAVFAEAAAPSSAHPD